MSYFIVPTSQRLRQDSQVGDDEQKENKKDATPV